MEQNSDSWETMMAEVQAFHDKHRFRETGGEEMNYRIALMAEELGEISSCVTKGKSREVTTSLKRFRVDGLNLTVLWQHRI